MAQKLNSEELLKRILLKEHQDFGTFKEISYEQFELYATGHLACPGTMFEIGHPLTYCPDGYETGASGDCSMYGGTGYSNIYCIS